MRPRTFIDIRFFINATEHVTAQRIANQLVAGVDEGPKWKVDGYRMILFGAEDSNGRVIQWGDPGDRRG